MRVNLGYNNTTFLFIKLSKTSSIVLNNWSLRLPRAVLTWEKWRLTTILTGALKRLVNGKNRQKRNTESVGGRDELIEM